MEYKHLRLPEWSKATLWKNSRLNLGGGVEAEVFNTGWFPNRWPKWQARVVGRYYFFNASTEGDAQDQAEDLLRRIVSAANTALSAMEAITPPSEETGRARTLARMEYEHFLKEMAAAELKPE